jgi:DNA repair protein RecN (Recombination protein N)
MIVELTVSNLGVIDTLSLTLPQGMIALTGETGAGKTLLVDALNLLVGGRADPGLVRAGADEATVDGRFELDGEEMILSRVVAAQGRSRAYLNGRPVTASNLAEIGSRLLDLHGQHTHQSLLGVEAQRLALDTFGHVDLGPLSHARQMLAEIDDALAELGGDERARARELDIVRFQVDELRQAELVNPDEEAELEQAEELLANAVAHQESARSIYDTLIEDEGARDVLAVALTRIPAGGPFDEIADRLRRIMAELDDVSDAIRTIGEGIEPDPLALDQLQARQRLLRDLRRKYGDDLGEVMAERDRLVGRLKELEDHDAIAADLDQRRSEALEELARQQDVVRAARLAAAPSLAQAIEARLPELAMAKARVGVSVEGADGSAVSFQLAANPGSELQPLSKVASGGELARTMLALRGVLSEAPPILVFDEVDAGIGGQAGLAVGRELSDLGDRHQVLVVTHLPQVAAFADAHLAVQKEQGDDTTVSEIRLLEPEERAVELARMLSGQPDSDTARQHAQELMDEAAETRRGR